MTQNKKLVVLLPLTSASFLLSFSHWKDVVKALSNYVNLVLLVDDAVNITCSNISIYHIKLPSAIKRHKVLRYIVLIPLLVSKAISLYKKVGYDTILALSGGPTSIAVIIIKLIIRKPLIVIVRTDFTEYRWYKISIIYKILMALHDALMRVLVYIANKNIAIYEHLYTLLRSLGVSKNKCELVYLGVDLKKFNYCYKCISTNEFIVGFTGRFSYENGSDLLISVAKELYNHDPNIKILIVGNKPSSNIDMPPNMLFTGFVNHKKVPMYMQSMDIFLSIKRSKGIPVAVMEALSCGVPVIGTSITDKVISQSGALLMFKKTFNESIVIQDIVRTLLRLKNDKTSLKLMSLKARNLAEKYFDLNRCAYILSKALKATTENKR